MHHLEIYEMLRSKLNKAPVGVPKGLDGEEKEILRILFSEDEAEFALKLPFVSFTLEDISKKIDKDTDSLKTTLDKMAKKGTVFKDERNGETVYRLLPVVIGWAETPFWPGPGKDARQEKLAPLWDEYWTDVWLDEIGDRNTPIMRTLPERDAISLEAQVMPYEDAVELVKARDYHVVAHCPCRIIARLSGKGCRHTLENCLHFGSMGRYMVKYGLGRKISVEETLQILKKANREGLVHVVENHKGRLNVLCNCCDDCCMWFRSIYEAKHPNALAKSNYYAEVGTEKCLACGICAIRCPMRAITVKRNKQPAKVDRERCIGCGVCYPTCPAEAIQLVKRDETVEPLDYQDYLAALLKDRGKDMSSLRR
ncbi:MAG: ATP-binding protein [Candidatus Bathyarchaeia archaeon]